MAEENRTARACPECASGNYAFRSSRQIEATDDQGPGVETKFRCKGRGHEWRERVPGVLPKRAATGPE